MMNNATDLSIYVGSLNLGYISSRNAGISRLVVDVWGFRSYIHHAMLVGIAASQSHGTPPSIHIRVGLVE
jgi:hypothetical protein